MAFILLNSTTLPQAPRYGDLYVTHLANAFNTTYGYEILRQGSSKLMQAAAEIALSHHEKFDGSGYPRGQKGEEISRRGRIVAVADVFDALTSERPYKQAWPLEKALELLREQRGRHFDPECVDAFLESLDEAEQIMREFRE